MKKAISLTIIALFVLAGVLVACEEAKLPPAELQQKQQNF